MAKRELRFAVVIYGGASLAVYMHGVTKELLKLVRASKVLHEMNLDPEATSSYADGPDQRGHDTEAVYFELLQRINRRNKFRVVVDVVAGASAGAINGIMMAKALVDDSLLDAHTDLWLGKADTDQLSGERRSRWRKWYLWPVLKVMSWWLPDSLTDDLETHNKLNRLIRSSWFRPPFSGSRLCHFFLEALDSMKRTARPNSSLLPHDQRLDVYASVTDLVGYRRDIELNHTLVAREHEHGIFCRLTHKETDVGRAQSDFRDDNLPALVWAARASSSYTGAFPPFVHAEMQQVLRERKQRWPNEKGFLRNNLFASDGTPATALFDPLKRYYVDGGIVNNKPFEAVLEALKHRSADRQVRRLIVYIEPDPKVDPNVPGDRAMSYLNTIRAAVTTIPRNQPVLDDLKKFVAQDKRVLTNRRVIDANGEQIKAIVAQLWPGADRPPASLEALRRARRALLTSADREMGLAYRAYVQRRLWRLTDALAEEWAVLTPELDSSEQQQAMSATLQHWWSLDASPSASDNDSADAMSEHDRQENFLKLFDVSFRIRRVLFVIRRLNQQDVNDGLDVISQAAFAEFKVAAYGFLEELYELRRARGIDAELARVLIDAAARVPLAREEAVQVLQRLAAGLALGRLDERFDDIFYDFCRGLDTPVLRASIAAEYVGFPMFDALLLTQGAEEDVPDPLTRIRVERISPPDTTSLASVFKGLKCRQFMGFLGFFNRGYREHDYLWGRLNGADRIVSFLLSAAGDELADVGNNPDAEPFSANRARAALYEKILQRERSRLHECVDTLAEVSAAVKAMQRAL
jgi:patatin-related protein